MMESLMKLASQTAWLSTAFGAFTLCLCAASSTFAQTVTTPIASPQTPLAANPSTHAPKVLIVVSSEGRNGGETRPGFEMDEYALAYLVFRANGVRVEVASPAGGPVEADKFNPKDDHIQALLADEHATALLRNTRRIADVKPGDHQAIFVMGGKGAMFDLPKDSSLISLLGAQFDRDGIVAAVCHGPAVFANVRRADGRPLIAGKRVTGFTDEEEKTFGKKWVKEYPFLIESKFREQGAIWEEAALMLPKTIVDDKLITGQNPFSTSETAEAIVRALGRTPAPRAVLKEERSMRLVQRWLAGEKDQVRAILAADAKEYKLDLIAMLGYYQAEAAPDDAAKRAALSIMEMAVPYMQHPRLRLGMARTHIALGNVKTAREILTALIAEKPDFADAKKALDALPG
ncbi:MAG: type 1 glutamine amidotransferase domain-containing protein [Betaproteobacteria bacterium]|nr:MAG: type 1 glutamine amidotransferase domain-containing protein [Betaproteobacteria bacterium]